MCQHGQRFFISICLLSLVCGCDDSPRFEAANVNQKSIQSQSWTTEKGRGGYEWKLDQQGQFAIPIPPMFPFLSELASQPRQTTLWPVKSANPEPWHRPEWMSDEVHEIFRRFTEPASKKILLQLPAKQISHTLAFDLSRTGETLVALSDGKIELYDLKLSSPPQSFLSPLKDAYGILTTQSKDKFYLCNSKSIALIDLTDLTIVAKEDTRFPVNHWEKAAGCDTLLAVTTDNVMTVFDSELKRIDQCHEFIDSNSLTASLDSEGEYVLATNSLNLFHWAPRIPESSSILSIGPQSSGAMESIPQSHSVLSGARFDCVWNSNSLRFLSKSSVKGKRILDNELLVRHNLEDMRIRNFGMDANDSYLICGKQKEAESNLSEYLAFDFGTASSTKFNDVPFRRSKPIKLGREPLKRLMTDQSGHTLVTLSTSNLTVLKRTSWMGPPDASLCHDLASVLVASSDFDQLERCAQELRFRDWPEHALWGEEVYRCFVLQVGVVTSKAISDPSKSESVNKWLEAGSDLAVLSKAIRATWIGNLPIETGNGSRDTSTRQGNRPDRFNLLESQLDSILKGTDAPAVAFWIKLHFARIQGKSVAEFEPMLKRHLELYPNQLDIHKQILFHMMSRSGPGSLPAQAYLSAISNTFSSELVDEATALMVNKLSPEQYQYIFDSVSWTKELERVERTVTKWIRDNEQIKIEKFFLGRPDLKKSLKKTGIDKYFETAIPIGL